MAELGKAPSLPHFDFEEITLEEKIAKGTATVYKAIRAGKTMAAKKMDCDKNEVPYEVEIHNSVPPHPNILPLLGVCHTKDGFTVYICTELANTSLHQYLHKEKKKPSFQQSIKWAQQIARGMHHIHQRGLAHRDLKSANVLLFREEGNSSCKLCDFGSARLLERTATVTGMTGTFRWMAPEFNDRATTKVNQRCDAFSYGMVMYELFAHRIPYADIDDNVAVASSVRDGKRPEIPPELPLYIRNLMQACWEHKPHDRPTFEQILRILDLEKKLWSAAKSGDAGAVEQLIADHVDINSRNEKGETALHLAAERGHMGVVRLLIGANADLNLQDEDGYTALSNASAFGQVDIVKLLLQKRADISICNTDGLSPLYVASQVGHTDIIDILIKAGADPNQADTEGTSPLMVASDEGHTHAVQRLVDGGAHINHKNKDGASPLYMASQEDKREVVDILLKHGADFNLAKKDGQTALFTATGKGYFQVVQLLLQKKADTSICNKDGATPLYMAGQEGHSDIVDTLMKNGADSNLTHTNGASPLYIASQNGHTEVVNVLLKNGANPNLADKVPPHSTPLGIAATNGHQLVVEKLLNAGANINYQDQNGKTAMDEAIAQGHREIVDLLKQYSHTY